MEQKNSPDLMPSWIPATGHALRHAGIHFDAVRIIGVLGEQVAYEVMQFTDFRAGPIVRSSIGERSMYFLLPPGSARAYRWPVGAEALVREGAAFVGVPAVHGLTYPLDWRSLPSAQVPFVDAELLFELLRKVVDDEIRAVR
ncbi:hypothetical protein P8A21_22540 [Streptomyces poriferorum]|uniref:DNA primase/polymerase bifunctional N-terminal domain-containing protein n=1 Tax=Streptomyces poriferorum TaxID=2798799 RepID=A0ABY9IT47_9ACTN|nr:MULTISPECIES: hypothetical protein [unclassified Streptomyces]MDP5313794.1 hypothetical protein [Streptomyces sp. Alt4]WLQ50081.1 hypothetical protein P8A21_22540 [Streptomyces sp. Alt1]WLQ57252.1 hypothetical protein P8A19_18145 [Streptomyces sp. Alt2]